MHLALVGKPLIDLDGLLVVSKEIWGHSLLARLDERHIPAGDLEKFLVAVAGFQSGKPETTVPKHLLVLVHLSWLAIADSDDLNAALNWLPTAERIVVPTERRGFVAAWIQTRLDQALTAVEDFTRYPKGDRKFFETMRAQLDSHGLIGLGQGAAPIEGQRLLSR